MAKYYIQSGNVSYLVGASDNEGAALWVMHRIMDDKICEFENARSTWFENGPTDQTTIDDNDELAKDVPQAIPYDAMLEGLAEFAGTIRISERGFGHTDAGELETEQIFHQWRQLMLAVDRLYDEGR